MSASSLKAMKWLQACSPVSYTHLDMGGQPAGGGNGGDDNVVDAEYKEV